LAPELLLIRPGDKLVYATDLADTGANRERLVGLARDANTLFCEAAFCEAETERAASTGHLTTRACGEIAVAANVGRLVPFHFSRRYEDDRYQVYGEVRAHCPQTVVPEPAA
jgi:ribonuclease BN (tRNA processing enzyme)